MMSLDGTDELTQKATKMSVTLAISDQLAALLHTLATQRGLSLEALGEQALAVGLTTLAGGATEIEEITAIESLRPLQTSVLLPSPRVVSGPVRPLQITFEPIPEGAADAP